MGFGGAVIWLVVCLFLLFCFIFCLFVFLRKIIPKLSLLERTLGTPFDLLFW